MKPQKLHVLIYLTENRQYAADCLELNVTATEPTPEDAAKEITELIDDHILVSIDNSIPPKKLFQKTTPYTIKNYERIKGFEYDYAPLLSTTVRDLIESIEFKIRYD